MEHPTYTKKSRPAGTAMQKIARLYFQSIHMLLAVCITVIAMQNQAAIAKLMQDNKPAAPQQQVSWNNYAPHIAPPALPVHIKGD